MNSPRPNYRFVEIAFIFLSFFIVGGGAAPEINEAQYLAKAKNFSDPSWCPGDHFLSSVDAHFFFFAAIGWLTRFVSLEATAWIGRIVAWLLLSIAWQRLSWRIVPKFGVSILSANVWANLTSRAHMSGEWVIGGIEGKVFAYVFVVFAIDSIATGRWKRVWPLLGIASCFHVLVGGWSVVAAMCAWLTSERRNLRDAVGLLPSLVLGGVFSLGGVVPALLLTRGVPEQTVLDGIWYYVFRRLQHHLVFEAFPWQLVTRFALMAVVWFVASMLLRTSAEYKRVFQFVNGSLLITLVGAVADLCTDDTYFAAQILRFYWFRLADISLPIGVSLGLVSILSNQLTARDSVWRFWSARRANAELANSELTKEPPPRIAITRISVALLTGATLLGTADLMLKATKAQAPMADVQGNVSTVSQLSDWKEVCQWANENTEPTARFFAPPNHQTFKWYADRSELVNWKDIPQDPKGIAEWNQRLKDARFFLSLSRLRTPEKTATRIRKLAEQYEFDYFLLDKRYQLPAIQLRHCFENRSYLIYAVN